MQHDERINRTRYRTLVTALGLCFALSLAGAALAYRAPESEWYGWASFLASALTALVLLPLALRAGRQEKRQVLIGIGVVLLAFAFLALLQRVAWAAFVFWPAQPDANPFRPIFNFLPFLYMAAVALLSAKLALRLCWTAWALITGIAFAGFWSAPVNWGVEGWQSLAVWLVLANPLFILLLHALPHYEAALADSAAEMGRMRERAELMERLSESERRFNLVVEGLQVGVWDRWLGPPERCWCSPRFYELIGYDPAEWAPSQESMLALLHPEDQSRIERDGRDQLRRGDVVDLNFRLRTRRKGYRWFNSHAKVERGADGRIRRIAGAIADIHDRRLAEQGLQEAQAELKLLVYRDPLTQLHNRRSFDEHFELEWGRSRAAAVPLSLLLIDLDFFKLFNDCYGHLAGDQCLQRVADYIASGVVLPDGSFAARLGGEEFGVLLPDTSEDAAMQAGERLREGIRGLDIRHDASPLGLVTASVGVGTAEAGPGAGTPAMLFEQADKALYQVKNSGRDGVGHARALRAAAA